LSTLTWYHALCRDYDIALSPYIKGLAEAMALNTPDVIDLN